MCNNYEARRNYREFVNALEKTRYPLLHPAPGAAPNLEPQPNVRPTDVTTVIRAHEDGASSELLSLKWGFSPPRPKAGPVINFRSEGRKFGAGRCVAPASAFFEYTGAKYPKTRWRVTLAGESWFGLGGWTRPGEQGFTLLTCAPGPDIATVHDRQMVVIRPADFGAWLDPETDPAPFMQPLPAGSLSIERDAPAAPAGALL